MFRKHKLDSLLSRVKSSNNAISEEEELEKRIKAEEIVDKPFANVDDIEEKDDDEIAKKYFQQMGNGRENEEETDLELPEMEEIFSAVDDKDKALEVMEKDTEDKPVKIETISLSEPVAEKEEKTPEDKDTEVVKESNDAFADIFAEEETEDKTFLDNLISSLSDVTAEEILKDIEEVNALMHEIHHLQGGKGGPDATS